MKSAQFSFPLSYKKKLPQLLRCCLVVIPCLCFLQGCYNEKFTTDPGDQLSFSTDTLSFDTVLTSVSTVTRSFKIYNTHSLSVKIDEVRLKGPQASFFTINVDGLTGDVIRDVEIRPNDSIYVFVEALIDPDQPLSISPFVLETDLAFVTNGNEQKVLIVAWGQNANYIPGPHTPNRISILTCDLAEETWDDPRPYVIYGTLLIDSCTLVLPPGARVYVHGGVANNILGIYNEGLIYTLPLGRIRSEGTFENPVIIRDDRIEPDHDGEWAGIRLGPDSGPHLFSHTLMTSGLVGIAADSASEVRIEYSSIAFTGGPGFFARNAKADIVNSLFYENGSQAIALTFGGEYNIDYCTMANFGNDSEALLMNNYYCTDALCSEGAILNKLSSRVRNCIMVGSSSDEVWIVDASEPQSGFLDIMMNNNIVMTDELTDPDLFPEFYTTVCIDCFEWNFRDTLFVDMDKYNFHLDTGSVAEMKAIPIPGITDDLDGNQRDPVSPDLGCYEFQ